MDSGGFSVVLRQILPRFNGKLFKRPRCMPLDRDQIGLLLEAARPTGRRSNPPSSAPCSNAPSTRRTPRLGAHYTPRAYVERLVLPTVIEPLRALAQRPGRRAAARTTKASRRSRAEIDAFHHRLCQMRVLDPACGSGNFLYVTLEHMKRLEGEVLEPD
jgi:hypothetical protein